MLNEAWIAPRLDAWARDWTGERGRISDIAAMPGNSGFSFGFSVTVDSISTRRVIRLPHPEAARTRNSDVLRQVRVLRAAASAGVPVPRVLDCENENEWFGVPFYVVDWVEGRSTHLFDPVRSCAVNGEGLQAIFDDAMAALGKIHQIPWAETLADWEQTTDLEREINLWVPTLMKSNDKSWIESGLALRDQLLKTRPIVSDIGVVHGDFYSNNWLFQDDRLTAVLDWEIASIGPAGIDLGWMCMIYDDECWGPERHRWSVWSPSREDLVRAYTRVRGESVSMDHLDWYQALACYRLACITARAIRHHRSGKRSDAAWEVLADAFPHMVARASSLISA